MADDLLTTPAPRINILDDTLCVSVALSKLGVNKNVSTAKITVNADKSMLRVSKKILKSPELKAIGTVHGKIKKMLRVYCLPATKLFRGGIFCVPSESAPIVDAELEKFGIELRAAWNTFFLKYDEQAKAAPDQLKDLYNVLDYPSLERVKQAFNMETNWINIGVPQNLEGISKSIFERETNKQAAKISEAADEIKLAIRTMMAELVDHMRERLTPDETNLDEETGLPKVKQFHKTMVERMNTFLELFDSKNVANDTELAALVAKAKTLMNGVNPKALRSNDDLRSYMVKGLDSIKASLDTMVVTDGGRMYQNIGDDDDTDEEAA